MRKVLQVNRRRVSMFLILVMICCGCVMTIQAEPAEGRKIFEGVYIDRTAQSDDTSEDRALSREKMEDALERLKDNGTEPGSRLYSLYEQMNRQDGIHLNYDVYIENLDSSSRYDVHCRDGVFYSRQSLLDEMYEGMNLDSGTFYENGEIYSLSFRDNKAILATTMQPELMAGNELLLDDLYSAIFERAKAMDYTEETRELDGVLYQVEVFPAGEIYPPEGVFLFREDGSLAYFLVSNEILGECIYKVNVIDDQTDDELLDLTGFEKTKLR